MKCPVHNKIVIFRYLLFAFLMLFVNGFASYAQTAGNAIWKKVEVFQTGIYRIPKNDILSMGFSSANDVAVVGNGGELISEFIDNTKEYQLRVQPSLVTKDGDLIFFATGLTNWYYDRDNNFYNHITNHYSNNSYVILTNDLKTKGFEKVNEGYRNGPSLSYYVTTALHESELKSLSESGRKLFGENLLNGSLSLSIENPQKSRDAKFAVAWTALTKNTDLTLSLTKGSASILNSTITNNDYQNKASFDTFKLYGIYRKNYTSDFFNLSENVGHLNLNISLSNNSNPSAYLDYVEVNYKNDADFSRIGQTIVRYPEKITNTEYIKSKGLEDKIVVKLNQFTGEKKIVETSDYLRFDNNDDMFVISDIGSAFKIGKTEDVVLNGILSRHDIPDMVIITTEELKPQAERLASFHKLNDAADVVVVTQSDVFNLFNSGTKDASCYRLLMNYFWRKKVSSSNNKNISLLLFGDGLYDNRKISSAVNGELLKNTEFLLTYQSENSLDIDSYTSDDFFGAMSNNISYSSAMDNFGQLDVENQRLYISIGRIPARTIDEASNVIDKIVNYYKKDSFGIWRTKTMFVADNGDANSHTKQSSSISEIVERLQPSINCEKIYLADYKRVSEGGKITVPDAKMKMLEALKNGVMLINYNGHGSPVSWTDEQILTMSDIRSFNFTKLPLWITATCDFCNYDSPNTSGAEQILLLPNSGGIALLSTSRVVWDVPNTMLNKAVMKELFSNTSDKNKTLGDVIRDSKNDLLGQVFPKNRLNFLLLGDPLLKIYIPSNNIKITQIDGKNADGKIRIKALQKINIKADIIDNGVLDANFNGKAIVTIYDSKKEKQTIDNFSRRSNNIPPFVYEEYSNIIFSSVVNVINGKIDFDFVVPKDVSYTNKNCRINLYAFDEQNKKHCIGSGFDMVISPSDGNDEVGVDNKPVVIRKITLAGLPFESGIVVDSSPTFFADLIDDSSVNLSNSGLGHSMTLSIDDKKETTYTLSQYYQPSAKEYGAGTVAFALPDLSEGEHIATFSVWDVAGNVTKKTIKFTVRSNVGADIVDFNIYPNPIDLSKDKSFKINVMYKNTGKYVNLDVSVYTLYGTSLVKPKMLTQSYTPELNSISSTWSIEKDCVPSGVYIIKMEVKENNQIKATESRVVIMKNE